jgi:hypothetical protein
MEHDGRQKPFVHTLPDEHWFAVVHVQRPLSHVPLPHWLAIVHS